MRQEGEVQLVLRVGDYGASTISLQTTLRVRVQLEPSVLRAPLEQLGQLGSRPLQLGVSELQGFGGKVRQLQPWGI